MENKNKPIYTFDESTELPYCAVIYFLNYEIVTSVCENQASN